jgi:hypothetical protein
LAGSYCFVAHCGIHFGAQARSALNGFWVWAGLAIDDSEETIPFRGPNLIAHPRFRPYTEQSLAATIAAFEIVERPSAHGRTFAIKIVWGGARL